MKRRVFTIWTVLTSTMLAFTGCRPQQPFYLHEDGDLSHYIDVASAIEYPDVETTTLAEVEAAPAPLTLENLKFATYWDLTLEQAIKNSMANSKVMRSLGGRYVSSAFNNRAQTGEAPDALLTSPDAVRTVYDPAITETTPFSGVEYALSAFDAQWTTSLFYQKNDHQQNVLPSRPISSFFQQVFQQDTSTFNTQLTKVTAQGGQFTVSNNIIYDFNNNPTRDIAKDYNVNYQVQFNQPLLAGAGAEFNRIAGPYNPFTSTPGLAQQTPAFDGVVLARIAVDISLADFEAGVRNLVSDTEQAYWELAFAWRNLETSNTALDSARQTWKKIHLLYIVGTKGGEAKEEAQAREQYFQFKATTQTLLNELFRAENRLRYVMGLAQADSRLIRPIDKPTVAKVNFDWRDITEEAMARSLDLRRQKWRIKQRELELIAAKNLLAPRLDLNGYYRWLGLGDQLVGTNANIFQPGVPGSLAGTSAIQNLTSGQFQEWQLGAQSTMSLGFRRELSTIRYYQLNLAKERAKLQDEELEVSHQLADAVRMLTLNYQLTQTNFNRTLAADREVEAVQAAFDAETVTLDQLLEAQRRRADSQTTYFRSLLDYQRGIMLIHYRKGSLLEYNGVYLAEGPWPAKAKFDAHRRARQRDASMYMNYGYTRPSVISQGPIDQKAGVPAIQSETPPTEGLPHEAAAPEELPTPNHEMMPTAASAELTPENSNDSRQRADAKNISAARRGFNWGPLGMLADEGETADAPAAKPATGFNDTASQNRSSADHAERQPTSNATRGRRFKTEDGSLQKVKYQQDWKSTPKHESLQNQSSDPTLGSAASGQGS